MSSHRNLFVNLAVENLDRSVAFFSGLGFSFDPRFTDETGTCMLVGENASVMLLVKHRFAEFSRNPISDAAQQTEAIYAFSVEDRKDVDRIADTALATGGSAAGDAQDHDFMYLRSFRDLDGHHFEVVWMDMSAFEAAEAPAGVAAT